MSLKKRPKHFSIERLEKLEKLQDSIVKRKLSLIKDYEINHNDLFENPFAWCNKLSISKFIAHYELMKRVNNLPGHIIELGVFKGNGLLTFSKLLEIMSPLDRTRKVFGFDHFNGLTDFDPKKDGAEYNWGFKFKGGFNTNENIVEELINISNDDNLLPGDERVILIKGDISTTVPEFCREMVGLKICLLVIDTDMYKSTKIALENLYDLVVPGGLIVLDEYALMPYQGETNAVDEFIREREIKLNFEKFSYTSSPSAFFIKE